MGGRLSHNWMPPKLMVPIHEPLLQRCAEASLLEVPRAWLCRASRFVAVCELGISKRESQVCRKCVWKREVLPTESELGAVSAVSVCLPSPEVDPCKGDIHAALRRTFCPVAMDTRWLHRNDVCGTRASGQSEAGTSERF